MTTNDDSTGEPGPGSEDEGCAAIPFDEHHLATYRYLYALTGDDALALDLTRATFSRSWRELRAQPAAIPRVQLLRLATRLAEAEGLRRRVLDWRPGAIGKLSDSAPPVAELETLPRDQVLLLLALRRLSRRDAACLLLRFQQHLSPPLLSETLDTSELEAESRLARARVALRAAYLGHGRPPQCEPAACRRVRAHLPLYLDRASVDELDAEAISRHLDGCDACRDCLSLDRRLATMLESLPCPALEPAAVAALRPRANSTAGREIPRSVTAHPANLLATIFGLGLTALIALLLIAGGAPLARSVATGHWSATAVTARFTATAVGDDRRLSGTLPPRTPPTPSLPGAPVVTTAATAPNPTVDAAARSPAPLRVVREQTSILDAPRQEADGGGLSHFPEPPDWNPESVVFVDDRHGWVLAGGCDSLGRADCSLLATDDGGNHWSQQFHTSNAIHDVFFLTAARGWMLVSPCPVGSDTACPTAIEATTNGGATWEQIGGETAELTRLRFATERDGTAIGRDCARGTRDCAEKILKTTDGGHAWTDVTPSDFSPTDAWFVDAAHGWTVGCAIRDRQPGANCMNPIVQATSDGGKTWISQLRFNFGVTQHAARLDFVSRTEGWLLLPLANEVNCIAENCWGPLYHTADSGHTWTQIQDWAHWDVRSWQDLDSTVAASGRPSDLHFISLKFGWISIERGPGPGGGGAALTMDGGKTWYLANGSSSWSIDGVAATAASPDKAWITGNRPLQDGSARFLLETDDLGRTWNSRLTTESPTTLVDFLDTSHGFGLGSSSEPGRVLRTGDGGRTWMALGGAIDAVAIDFVDAADGWLAGDDGSHPVPIAYLPGGGGFAGSFFRPIVDAATRARDLMVTNDGGQTWRTIERATEPIVWVHFFDRRAGLVVTRDPSGSQPAKLLATRDGGVTWSPRGSLPSSFELEAVSFASPSDGWILQRSSEAVELLRTSDGGLHWSILGTAPGWTNGSATLKFRSDYDGWLGFGLGTSFLHTGDGGQTWTRINLPPGIEVQQLDFVDSAAGWLVTSDGHVLHTTDSGDTWVDPACWSPRPAGSSVSC